MTLVQVLPEANGWILQLDGDRLDQFASQAEAVSMGRSLAKEQRAEFQLYGADGSIREKESYGNDPSNIPG